ncbi:hemolysin secretion protein D [Marinobacterium zhoushanense]|uniref:Hemolysin secretion protein D n=1 Tax=Marinobacterium zhoushanense TaxID=1679163 RepID=A0ABQ1KHU8_9GAMM|nr:efflux RND transporter periplasmic adaptor subunit [Marinobacterium zhoushanense]GGC00738.1 hemolysin secretion protein D [Marinobacterium zhoushanense]
MKSLGLLLSAVFLALPLLSGCSDDSDKSEVSGPPPLRPVKTLVVQAPQQGRWRELPGVVKASREVELAFRVSGKLEQLPVKEGDRVQEKQLLAQLDATDFNIQLNARLAEYDQALADFERGQTLVQKNLIARADFDKLKAQYESAKAALESARQNVEYTSLRAPFAGRVAKRNVESFEELAAGQPVLVLQDTNGVSISVDVPESIMIRVREDAVPELTASFDQIPDQQFPLSLLEVSTQADKSSNTYKVTFAMHATEGYNLLPGMSATVRGQADPRVAVADLLYLPAQAVLEDDDGHFVYLVDQTQPGQGSVERRAVEVGSLTSLGLEVISGLAVGDRVVVAGMSKMHAGLEVKLMSEVGQ